MSDSRDLEADLTARLTALANEVSAGDLADPFTDRHHRETDPHQPGRPRRASSARRWGLYASLGFAAALLIVAGLRATGSADKRNGSVVAGQPQSTVAGELAAIADGKLVILDEAGDTSTIAGPVSPTAIEWSHGGGYIAVATPKDIWVVEANKSTAHRVEASSRPNTIRWSTKAEVLAISGDGVAVFDVEGDETRTVSTEAATSLEWSPDGTKLATTSATSGGGAVSLIDVASGESQQIVDPTSETGYTLASWEPNGDHLLAWAVPGSSSLAADGAPLVSLDTQTGGNTVLTRGLVNPGWIQWSDQSGTFVAVTSETRYLSEGQSIVSCDVDAATCTTIVESDTEVYFAPRVSSDGDRLTFVAAPATSLDLSDTSAVEGWMGKRTAWIANTDGTQAHPIEGTPAAVIRTEWSDADHVLVFSLDDDMTHGTLTLLDATGTGRSRTVGTGLDGIGPEIQLDARPLPTPSKE
jgi:hypothetical protein